MLRKPTATTKVIYYVVVGDFWFVSGYTEVPSQDVRRRSNQAQFGGEGREAFGFEHLVWLRQYSWYAILTRLLNPYNLGFLPSVTGRTQEERAQVDRAFASLILNVVYSLISPSARHVLERLLER